jgi:isocitrate/isopropylmalate dehydrogenase
MLEALGYPEAAMRLERAVSTVVAEGPTTSDIGGHSTTTEVGRAIAEAIQC